MAVISNRHATRLLLQRLSKPSAESERAVNWPRYCAETRRLFILACAAPGAGYQGSGYDRLVEMIAAASYLAATP